MALYERISKTPTLSKELVMEWNNAKDLLDRKYVDAITEISPVASEKYKFDLAGLFINELKVQKKFVYPHIIVNGFMSGDQYDGKELRFKMLNTAFLSAYDKLIRSKKKVS